MDGKNAIKAMVIFSAVLSSFSLPVKTTKSTNYLKLEEVIPSYGISKGSKSSTSKRSSSSYIATEDTQLKENKNKEQ